MKFIKHYVCRLFAHCTTCRDREGGRYWREAMARTFTMPDGAPDFPCPYGKAWGEVVPVTIRSPPERISDDHDPEAERRRLKAGGCCGEPSGE